MVLVQPGAMDVGRRQVRPHEAQERCPA
jgi:hypothetical protein